MWFDNDLCRFKASVHFRIERFGSSWTDWLALLADLDCSIFQCCTGLIKLLDQFPRHLTGENLEYCKIFNSCQNTVFVKLSHAQRAIRYRKCSIATEFPWTRLSKFLFHPCSFISLYLFTIRNRVNIPSSLLILFYTFLF